MEQKREDNIGESREIKKSKSSFVTFYLDIIEQCCTSANALYEKNELSEAIFQYQEALKNYENLQRLHVLTKVNLLHIANINHYIYYFLSKSQGLQQYLESKNYLHTAFSYYQYISDKENANICASELSELERNINNRLNEKTRPQEFVDAIVLSVKLGQEQSFPPIYKSKHAAFILKELESNKSNEKIIIHCEGQQHFDEVYQWLNKLRFLISNRPPKIRGNSLFEISTQDPRTIFQLKQWQQTTAEISRALHNKDWKSVVEHISKINTYKQNIRYEQRINLLEAYQKKLLPKVAEEDRRELENAFMIEKISLEKKPEKKKLNLKHPPCLEEKNQQPIDLPVTPTIQLDESKISETDTLLHSHKKPKIFSPTSTPVQTFFNQRFYLSDKPQKALISDLSKSSDLTNECIKTSDVPTSDQFPSNSSKISLEEVTQVSRDGANHKKVTPFENLKITCSEEWKQTIKELRQAWCELKKLIQKQNLPVSELPTLSKLGELGSLEDLKNERDKFIKKLDGLKQFHSPHEARQSGMLI